MGKKLLSTMEWSIYRCLTEDGAVPPSCKEDLVRDLAVKFGLSPVMMQRVDGEYVPYDYNEFTDAIHYEGDCEPYFAPDDCERVTGSRANNWIAWGRVATECGTDSHPDLLSMVVPDGVKETLKQRGFPYRGNIRMLSLQMVCFYVLAQRSWDKDDMNQIVRVVRMKNLIADHLSDLNIQPLPAYLPPGVKLKDIMDGPESSIADLDAEIQAAVGKPEKETTSVRIECKPRPGTLAPGPLPDFMPRAKRETDEKAAATALHAMVTSMEDEEIDDFVEMLIAEKNRRKVTNASSAKIKDGELDYDRGIMHWVKLTYPDGQTARYLREDHVLDSRGHLLEKWVDPAEHLLDSLA